MDFHYFDHCRIRFYQLGILKSLSGDILNLKCCYQGRNWVILKGGRRYICYRKAEIIHGPSVKCVSSLLETWRKPKYEMQEGARTPSSCAPGYYKTVLWVYLTDDTK